MKLTLALNHFQNEHLSTQCAKDCGPYNRAFKYGRSQAYVSHNPWHMDSSSHILMCVPQIFSKFLHVKYRVYNETCKKLSYRFFDYEGHNS